MINMKDKYFAEQTLINLFRHRNPKLQEKPIEKLALQNVTKEVKIVEKVIPQRVLQPHPNGLQDVVEYKRSLESKMNEADIIEKEERVLLEKKIEELHKVSYNQTIGKRN